MREKIEISYLGTSGFALAYDKGLLVMDCCNPQKHALLREEALRGYNAVTILVSHRHSDHYSRLIFDVKPAAYVVSFDVPAPNNAIKLRPGDTAAVNGMDITAFGSTDEGVSFHIAWNGLSLFHAGDLNDWHWREESSKAYADEAEANFLTELGRIRADVTELDIAFFPVDPRMGADYYRGAVLFAKAMRPKHFVPMHFGGTFSAPDSFYTQMTPFTTLYTQPLSEGTAELML